MFRLNQLFRFTGNVYIADQQSARIRKITAATGTISSIAGKGSSGTYSGDGGAATSAGLNYVRGVALDASGTTLYVV